jgi:hypothetical protein
MSGNEEEKFLEKLADGFRFFAQLSDDVDAAKRHLDKTDSQFSRRMYIRSLFAFIEGNSFRLRRMALDAHHHRKNCFSGEEIQILEEKETIIKENGDRVIKTKYLRFLDSIRFSQDCYMKAIGGKKQPDYGNKGWEKLIEAVSIRNRITHPKTADDLKIKDEELTIIDEAKHWYSDNVQFLL